MTIRIDHHQIQSSQAQGREAFLSLILTAALGEEVSVVHSTSPNNCETAHDWTAFACADGAFALAFEDLRYDCFRLLLRSFDVGPFLNELVWRDLNSKERKISYLEYFSIYRCIESEMGESIGTLVFGCDAKKFEALTQLSCPDSNFSRSILKLRKGTIDLKATGCLKGSELNSSGELTMSLESIKIAIYGGVTFPATLTMHEGQSLLTIERELCDE